MSDARGLVETVQTTQGLAAHAGITVGICRCVPGTAVEWVDLLNVGLGTYLLTHAPASTRLPASHMTVLRNVLLLRAEGSMFDRDAFFIDARPCLPFWPYDRHCQYNKNVLAEIIKR